MVTSNIGENQGFSLLKHLLSSGDNQGREKPLFLTVVRVLKSLLQEVAKETGR